MGSPNLPLSNQNTKMRNGLKLEKRDLSYADLHSEVMKNVDNIPPTSSSLHQKLVKNEELVKHMSKLPHYLEQGENLQDKALNVGVLDWRSLERWHYNHKQIPHRSSRDSTSSSNTSSLFSTNGSSNHSSRGHSCSPAHQKMRRPTLQSYLNASPREGKFQDLKAVSSNPLKGTYQSSSDKNPSEIKLKKYKRKDSAPQPLSSKGKMKIQDGESTKEPEKLQDPYHNIIHHDCPETVVLLLPNDSLENSHSALSHPFDPMKLNSKRSRESRRKSFSEGFHSKEVYHTEPYSVIPHSWPLPCEVDGIRHSGIEQPSSIDTKSVKFPSDPSQPSPSPAKKSISPSKSKILEEKKSTIMPISSTVIQSCKGSDPKRGISEGTKVRNQSPTRRFILSMGRNSSSKDSVAIPQSSSKHVPPKSGEERAEASACSENSTTDKPSTTVKARSSSPLRRLLDPLLKPKAANSHQSVEPSQKGSTSTDGACKSSDGRGESSTVHTVKLKLDLLGCRKTDIDEQQASSTVQALLQIAVKNGLPLFTFAVDNSSEVLAATMRRLSSSRKDGDTWIYTFFSIREMRKKNGSWLNQGGKGKGRGHGYIPNVVAQMKVSENSSSDQFITREFVSFAVDLRMLDQQTSDVQPNDELAGIVVKLSRKTIRGLNQDGLKESSTDVRGYSDSRDSEENGLFVGSQDLFSTTVIVPGGVHGLPSKGEPSPLIERWKSGGLCDCGGWDLGCRVRVLSNQTQHCGRSSSTEAHQPTGRFELFSESQGDVLDKRPVFSLSSFKNGIFSVEFNSSLSLLQAFSICIAVLDSRKPPGLSESSNSVVEKAYEEATLLENEEVKDPNRPQVEIPPRYTSYPPLSPVERV